MAKKVSKRKSHTGQTASGNTRDMKVDKVGKVTIYKRGSTYYLYYREAGESQRVRIDGNLSVARASAAKVAAALEESRPSPMSFQHTSPAVLIREYLDYAEHVQCLAWRTPSYPKTRLANEQPVLRASGDSFGANLIRSAQNQPRTDDFAEQKLE